jgi:ankyrin repeat protein
MARLYISHGADVNAINNDGQTPLFNACTKDIAQLLISHGADVNKADYKLRTPLHLIYNVSILKLLIDNKADINAKTNDGSTPLHYHHGNIKALRLLIKNGADVNDKNRSLSTVLHRANSTKIIKFLIDKGANLNQVDNSGVTPLDMIYKEDEARLLINANGLGREIKTYKKFRNLFTKDQQEAFDTFASIANNDDNFFFQMCLTYQNDQQNHIKIEIKDMEIL